MNAAPSPKDRFSSLDTLAVVRELRAFGPARVDKAFDLTEGGWSLTLRSAGEGRRELVLVPGRYAALVAEGPGRGEQLSPFARELRRLLSGAAVRSIAEPHGERYLEVALGRSDEPEETLLALEMFGSGNLTVARAGKILAVATARRWAHRTVRVGAPYVRPPQRQDPWSATHSDIAAELARSRTDLASTLAARLSLGGPIAEELIARIGRSGSEAASSEPSALAGEIHGAIAALLQELGDRPRGFRYARGESVVDATPYRSRRWAGAEDVVESELPTFSEVAFDYFRTLVPPTVPEEERQAAAGQRELERQIDRQRDAIQTLGRQVEELQDQAETIFAHYSEAEQALTTDSAKAAGKRPIPVPLGDRTVPLYPDRSPRESAQELYEDAKRLSSKLAGARAALAETEARLAQPTPAASLPRSRAATKETGRRLWFERYRWFVSSEHVIVIAGRDAGSNDLIVRRNLKAGDLYLHADLHGASSVVVKRPGDGAPITEATLREAGQWAVAFSKAWRAGLASASAFWVTPEQVSKAAATGEFVPKGAWVIHGTKNVLRDLPLELALGPIAYEGAERWTVAPASAVRALGTVRVLLTPGDERERAAREVELSKELDLPRPLLQSLLPAGGLTVRRP
jgi:predicted ribosome quality control (RQC) complex YloA/Tae2 family protein